MKFAKSSNIYETFGPFYKACKLFGVIPFEMNLRNGTVRVRIFDFIQTLLIWIVWTCLLYFNVEMIRKIIPEHFTTGEIITHSGWQFCIMLQLTSCFIVCTMSFCTRRKFEKFFKVLFDVDEMVSCELKANDYLT